MQYLSLTLLGTPQIVLRETPEDAVPIRGRILQALLAFLTIESDSAHSRESLAALLWPEQSGSLSRANLRQTLFRLRRVLGDEQNTIPFLLFINSGIQFNVNSPHWLDVAEFKHYADFSKIRLAPQSKACMMYIEQLERVVELYRGEFMAGLALPGCVVLEDWLYFQRNAYREQYLDALARLAGYCEQTGDYQRAKEYAYKQIELSPWRESAHCQMMRALALNGEHSTALKQYRVCCEILEKEIGTDPEAETTALFSKIKRGEWPGENQNPDRSVYSKYVDDAVLDVLEAVKQSNLQAHADLGTLLAMVFMGWIDGSLDQKEAQLIQQKVKEQELDDQDLSVLMQAMLAPPSLDVIISCLTTPESKRSAAVAAYVTALIDHNLAFAELDAFDDLCQALGLSKNEQEEIRSLAYQQVREATG